MKLIELASAITSLFPFMILENFGSVTSVFYHLHRNESMYKLNAKTPGQLLRPRVYGLCKRQTLV